jgi:methylmalonyl-CoA mutase
MNNKSSLVVDKIQTECFNEEKLMKKIRFVTAAALFDGHDAAINIIRRLLQAGGAEVIHLGHNRSVQEIVETAIQEDVQGIAISSYQGGHVEFFKYMIDLLKEKGASQIKVFGGGGGVIVPKEIEELHQYGVAKIYSPEDGQTMGLEGMIQDMFSRCLPIREITSDILDKVEAGDKKNLALLITGLENEIISSSLSQDLIKKTKSLSIPTLGITGTGGAGKSSLTDELIRRLRIDLNDQLKIAVISIDPSRRKSGGALLGDRIRMNAIDHPNIYMRSLATRDSGGEISKALPLVIQACRLAKFDLILVETSGIGQGDAAIVPLVDSSLYVMTPEFGAASQLEKIDMLDFADFVAINKFDRKGALDALRDVRKQVQRNQTRFHEPAENMPVFGTQASKFNDDGVTALYQEILSKLKAIGLKAPSESRLNKVNHKVSTQQVVIVPAHRQRYLAEISETIRSYHQQTNQQAILVREIQHLTTTKNLLEHSTINLEIQHLIQERVNKTDNNCTNLLNEWPKVKQSYAGEFFMTKVRDKEISTKLVYTSLSGTKIKKVALPNYQDSGDLLTWLRKENLPGSFPYTAGVFLFKRENEDPTRMFAGEGDAFRTNRRFKLLSQGMEAKRLSTAFDSVTLYGCDPHERPDIYGKIGNSGVSIATLDDMKVLYDGFDLCDPTTSVSMTINGPAPTILAMFMNTAIDQYVERFEKKEKRKPDESEYQEIKKWVLENVRGTVQADILKEDQGQNTCIFSTEFSLKVMGDIAEYFVQNKVRNFYSVSISGYHIAEAGANPISQLAFTLANGFTFVEAYLARGMKIDDFAPNLSFFFSNGMDPEYCVLGRVARRIWAIAMKNKYGANDRSQKLKYHIQTSGRSLHAQEIDFNDIRTTLQALIAIYDNCNSLHTNAYDEAITTPTEESVRRALAIQLIINREWGLAKNENPNQGSFILDELTDLVEEAVLQEFEKLSERGGVLGAMETGYQRGRIQEESLYYEQLKHDGTYPIIGVNTFRNPKGDAVASSIELARSTQEEKQSQLTRLENFKFRNKESSALLLKQLQEAVIKNENVFAVLMDAVRYCSLGQITQALFEVGGQYRRNM